MSWMFTLLLVVQVLASLSIISLVLLQQGKGADMGSSFGSGSAGSLFGATGAANFMSRATKWAAVVFFISTIGLAYVGNRGATGQDTGVMSNFSQTAPAVPAASGSLVPGAAPAGAASSTPNAAPVVPQGTIPGATTLPAPAIATPAMTAPVDTAPAAVPAASAIALPAVEAPAVDAPISESTAK